jgi:hypothetical protein
MLFDIRRVENWITDDEREKVRLQVHAMREQWRHIKTFPIASDPSLRKLQDSDLVRSAENQYFLGDSLYVITNLDQIDWNLQVRLRHEFSWLQDRLLKSIEDISGHPARFMDNIARPGFHVFHGKQDHRTPFQWHVDTTINRFDRQYDMEQIYSFLSLIESPDDFAGLEYKNTGDWAEADEMEFDVFKYEPNQLFMWKGDKIHRMKRFRMTEGESRITLQGHFIIHRGEALVHW